MRKILVIGLILILCSVISYADFGWYKYYTIDNPQVRFNWWLDDYSPLYSGIRISGDESPINSMLLLLNLSNGREIGNHIQYEGGYAIVGTWGFMQINLSESGNYSIYEGLIYGSFKVQNWQNFAYAENYVSGMAELQDNKGSILKVIIEGQFTTEDYDSGDNITSFYAWQGYINLHIQELFKGNFNQTLVQLFQKQNEYETRIDNLEFNQSFCEERILVLQQNQSDLKTNISSLESLIQTIDSNLGLIETQLESVKQWLFYWLYQGTDVCDMIENECPKEYPNDDDRDGIPNNQDECSDTRLGEEVDNNGCSNPQFCKKQAQCGYDCDLADWKNNEVDNPHDCITVVIYREGTFEPICTGLSCAD